MWAPLGLRGLLQAARWIPGTGLAREAEPAEVGSSQGQDAWNLAVELDQYKRASQDLAPYFRQVSHMLLTLSSYVTSRPRPTDLRRKSHQWDDFIDAVEASLRLWCYQTSAISVVLIGRNRRGVDGIPDTLIRYGDYLENVARVARGGARNVNGRIGWEFMPVQVQ